MWTKHRIFSVYHPRMNGIVERFNQTMQRSLVNLMKSNQTKWDEKIDEVLLVYWTAQHPEIHTSTSFWNDVLRVSKNALAFLSCITCMTGDGMIHCIHVPFVYIQVHTCSVWPLPSSQENTSWMPMSSAYIEKPLYQLKQKFLTALYRQFWHWKWRGWIVELYARSMNEPEGWMSQKHEWARSMNEPEQC